MAALAIVLEDVNVLVDAVLDLFPGREVALGAIAAIAGGASPLVGAVRVTFWGALAMAITAGVGTLFGTTVG